MADPVHAVVGRQLFLIPSKTYPFQNLHKYRCQIAQVQIEILCESENQRKQIGDILNGTETAFQFFQEFLFGTVFLQALQGFIDLALKVQKHLDRLRLILGLRDNRCWGAAKWLRFFRKILGMKSVDETIQCLPVVFNMNYLVSVLSFRSDQETHVVVSCDLRQLLDCFVLSFPRRVGCKDIRRAIGLWCLG